MSFNVYPKAFFALSVTFVFYGPPISYTKFAFVTRFLQRDSVLVIQLRCKFAANREEMCKGSKPTNQAIISLLKKIISALTQLLSGILAQETS